MTPEHFFDGKIALWGADCLAALPLLPENSVDSCVTDPPYHLVSIVRRFSKASINGDSKIEIDAHGRASPYGRGARGFMGKIWDGGDIAFRPEVWREVWRVLKPGGHIVAFGGTRTYHRMACAIEDAGFEIRDQIGWAYGSGFPKSHDVSKGIDRLHGAEREVIEKGAPVKRMIPGADQNKDGWEKNNGRVFVPTTTVPATEEAERWSGWGTALKPAWEPIVVARKPLSEPSVAANVLRWGTGALNIDGCLVAHANGDDLAVSQGKNPGRADTVTSDVYGADRPQQSVNDAGRWPANIIHDGSDEVVAAFPDSNGGHWSGETPSLIGEESFDEQTGSAARFFYAAKADLDDRLGSKHPTVKPVDLMQYLARLVTPPGGTVLDPFAGTGTTGEAAWREGFRAVLIERETEYQADIRRRMALILSGPDERAREAMRAKMKDKPVDHGPLFGGTE